MIYPFFRTAFLTFGLLLSSVFSAQSKMLDIGNKCPDFKFDHLVNGPQKSINLSDYEGKLIILDFWSTNCIPCILAMPKLDSLQKKYEKEIQVIPVNSIASFDSQTVNRITKFWKTNKLITSTNLFTVIDTSLTAYFPHDGVPHVVWIDGNRRVQAITTGEYVNEEKIKEILQKGSVNWPVNRWQESFDYQKPFWSHLDREEVPFYYSAMVGYLPGVKYKSSEHNQQSMFEIDRVTNQKRYFQFNASLLNLYRSTIRLLNITFNRVILDVKDSSRFYHMKDEQYLEEWKQKNVYSYEAIVPASLSDSAFYEFMRYDLNRFLGLNGRIEVRNLPCLVLQIVNKRKFNQRIKDYKGIKGKVNFRTIESLIANFNYRTFAVHIPVVDKTGYFGNLDLNISYSSSLGDINEELSAVGLHLKMEKSLIQVLVISE